MPRSDLLEELRREGYTLRAIFRFARVSIVRVSRGLPVSQQLVYLEEYARANAPYISVNFVGMMHA